MRRALMIVSVASVLAGCAGGLDLAAFEPRPVVPAGYGKEAGDPYQLGKRQLEAGNVGLAIDAFRKALRADPNSLDALNGLGVAYDRIARFDLSRRYYEQALGIAPRSAMILHNYGYSLALQGQPAEGRELMARAAAEGDPAVVAAVRANLADLPAASPAPARDMADQLAIRAARQWIERTTALVQTLVTDGETDGEQTQVEPRLRKVHDVADRRGQPTARGSAMPPTSLAVSAMARMTNETLTIPASEGHPLLVVNAVGRTRMATRMRGYLTGQGVGVAGLSNGATRNVSRSEIRFDEANRQTALAVARLLPFDVALRPRPAPSAGVILVLGRNALGFDDKLQRQHREV